MGRRWLGLLTAFLLVLSSSLASDQTEPADSEITTRDNAVVLVVLESLLEAGKQDPFVPGAAPTKPILFDLEPNCHSLTVEQILEQHEKKKWAGLTAPELTSVREAAEHLVARTSSCRGEFAVSHPRVQLRRGDPENAGFRDRTSSAFLPGFSKDGRTAIVLLAIPWSIHVAEGTHVLIRGRAGWRIRVRDFVYYM